MAMTLIQTSNGKASEGETFSAYALKRKGKGRRIYYNSTIENGSTNRYKINVKPKVQDASLNPDGSIPKSIWHSHTG